MTTASARNGRLLLLLLLLLLGGVFFFDLRVLKYESVRHGGFSSHGGGGRLHSFNPSSHWSAEWVVVVTNYERDLGWLSMLPLHLGVIKVAVYIKWDHRVHRSCEMIPADVKPHLAFCREVPNAHGREAHTMASFIVEFYDRLPRMLIFLQVRRPHSRCSLGDSRHVWRVSAAVQMCFRTRES